MSITEILVLRMNMQALILKPIPLKMSIKELVGNLGYANFTQSPAIIVEPV